jgi:translation initiation factor IF-2
MRVHQLAKELDLSSQELIEKLKSLNINAKSHMSSLAEDVVEKVRSKIARPIKEPKTPKAKERKRRPKKVEAQKEEPKPEKLKPEKPRPKKETKPEEPKPEASQEKEQQPQISIPREIQIKFPITVKELAVKLQQKSSAVIKVLMGLGVFANINQVISEDTVFKVVESFGCVLKKLPTEEEQLIESHAKEDDAASLKVRPPVVTFMGHVDHGKTSLLDMIRKSQIVEKEHGGITQHIGAYKVVLDKGQITFLDTPGHEAFTAMRARGANITDVVVLVVAADEGVMPQTVEAIDHSRAAGVPIVVAINKIDKPNADIDKVKKQLADLGLTPEDWGGKTITVGVSAKTGQGVDELLEMMLLEAEMLELKANDQRQATGIVVDAKLTKGKGPLATLIIQNGTLNRGDIVIAGHFFGRIKAMFDDHERPIQSAGPAEPVEILGLSGVPQAGEQFYVIDDERRAKEICLKRQETEKQKQMRRSARISLDDLYSQIRDGQIKELKIILKADVQGSLEALKDSLEKLSTNEVQLNIIHCGIGAINTSDVVLAVASNAVIIGFHVDIVAQAKEQAEKEEVDIHIYRIIYEAINEMKAALEGLLEPKIKRIFLGRVEVRQVFKLSKAGIVAGCFVQKGKVNRSASIDLIRNGEKVYEGKISSLKRFKDDVREVQEGFECGITLSNYTDIKSGDIIEVYDIQKIARKL